MKRLISLVLTIAMLSSISMFVPITTNAAIVDSGICGDNLTWTLDEDGTLTISGTGDMWDWSYEERAPWSTFINNLIIESGITKIGDWAFRDCQQLTDVSIPDSVISIGDNAFYSCIWLKNIKFGTGILNIGKDVFDHCFELRNVYIRDLSSWCNITLNGWISSLVYGINLYINGELIEDITIPENIENINSCTFANFNITSVTIPDNIKEIGWSAFSSCRNLKNVYIGDGVSVIEAAAFRDCISLTNVFLGCGVERIGESVFDGCTSLSTITIPSSLTVIDDYAFWGCQLNDVYYSGSAKEWQSINFSGGSNFSILNRATLHYDYKTETDEKKDELLPNVVPTPENNPTLSAGSAQTITLGEQKWITSYVGGIYSEIPSSEFNITSSNEDVVKIISQYSSCGGVSNPFDSSDVSYLTSMDAFVQGMSPGTATLTYYCQGENIGTIDVTVEAAIADTISDELVLKAKICADNPTYKYMIDTFNNPATLHADSSSDVAAQMNNDLNSFIDAFSLEFDSKNYYEAVLMDMVTSDTFYDTVKDSLYLDNLEFAAKKLNKVGSFAEDEINKLLSDEIKKGFDVDKFFNDISILDAVITAKDSFDAMNDKYKQLTALCLVSEEQICALEQLKEISTVSELTEACDTVMKAVKEANEKAVNKIAEGVFEGVEELFENVGQYGWDSLISLVPGVNAAKAIVASAQLVSNGLFNQDELSNDILLMDAVSVIDRYMNFKVKNTETIFADYPTRDNAVRFMACANFYKALCKYGCIATEKFFRHYDDALITKLTGNNQEDRINIIQYITESVDDWDLYNPMGIDISKYLRNVVSETPSEWAKEYVEKAKNYGFLWPDMQNNYQNNITRAEFCMLLYNTMALKNPIKFEEIQSTVNKKITVEFDDVLFYYVTQVAKMGIINGTGNNKFEPLGDITRQQAAKMLCAAAEVMGYNTNAPTTNIDGVSDWAVNGVNFVVDRGIMTGTDNGFEPQGTYTKEQAITTMVRFFENLK